MTQTPRTAHRMLVLVALLVGACDAAPRPAPPVAAGSAPKPSTAEVADGASLRRATLAAERARDVQRVPEAALHHPDARVRRAAARALSRIGSPEAATLLTAMLPDEDPEVLAFAAYGLGYGCRGRERDTVAALASRAATLAAAKEPVEPPTARLAPDPVHALAGALARCATAEAERTLVAWTDAGEPWAGPALRALVQLAPRRARLEDATQVALVHLAREGGALAAPALRALGATRLDVATSNSVLEAARDDVSRGDGDVGGAIAAAAAVGPAAAGLLGEILRDPERKDAERAAAARALGSLGLDGQGELREAVTSFGRAIGDTKAPADALVLYVPLLATLQTLVPPVHGVGAELTALAELPEPPDDDAPAARRLTHLRCRAAALLADRASLSARLVACDPAGGVTGPLAVVDVLDRGELTGARARRYRELLAHEHPAVATAALSIAARHPEMSDLHEIVATALGRDAPGVVATAAQLVLDHPERVSLDGDEGGEPTAPRPAPEVATALVRALEADRPPDQIEVRGLLLRAAARLGLLSVKARAERDCLSDNATVRRHAALALGLLGGTTPRCAAPENEDDAGDGPAPTSPGTEPVTLTFVTDHGRLGVTLDPRLAPLATARVLELVDAGFFDGMPIHRVVPGRVVQFGDPGGDGYGGAGRSPLPSETSPLPFEPLSVGMALSGRDTGSSQLFVTLTRQPELDGDYPLIGYGDLEWREVARGDVIRKVVRSD